VLFFFKINAFVSTSRFDKKKKEVNNNKVRIRVGLFEEPMVKKLNN